MEQQKLHINNKPKQKTLDDFRETMFMLLQNKSFEEISVNEICTNANYPRATFYNYFPDKFHLLNYCWKWMFEMINVDLKDKNNETEICTIIFYGLYDFKKANLTAFKAILEHNQQFGYLFSSFRNFMNNQIANLFKNCSSPKFNDFPVEMLADHYGNALILVWKWCSIKNDNISKEIAYGYLKKLLGHLLD